MTEGRTLDILARMLARALVLVENEQNGCIVVDEIVEAVERAEFEVGDQLFGIDVDTDELSEYVEEVFTREC